MTDKKLIDAAHDFYMLRIDRLCFGGMSTEQCMIDFAAEQIAKVRAEILADLLADIEELVGYEAKGLEVRWDRDMYDRIEHRLGTAIVKESGE